jgi:hypothetical protein
MAAATAARGEKTFFFNFICRAAICISPAESKKWTLTESGPDSESRRLQMTVRVVCATRTASRTWHSALLDVE